MVKKDPVNPWNPDDEREHYPCVIEWWAAEAFFDSVEDNKKWCLKASFTEWVKKSKISGSNYILTLFDLSSNKYYNNYSMKDYSKLESSKKIFDIKYEDSSIKGSYPNYEMHFYDSKNNINLDLNYHADSLPHWIAQDITNGWLPMNLGLSRYGFIPKCKLLGTMNIKNKKFMIKGKGYFEHVWGNFSYTNPILYASNIKKTVSVYSKLIGWWLNNHKFRLPKSIKLSTENNPFGYDWIWAIFDNGWSLFYGNILLWIMKGPIFGSLIITKDGKTYTEFCNATFYYNNMKYVKKYDFYYPLEIVINAKKGKEKIHLIFKNSVDSHELLMKLTDKKNAFFICESPGSVIGYYYDGKKKIDLKGVCKFEPQRQISKLGHNSLKIDFHLPPRGFGIDIDIDSHYLKKNLTTRMHIVPRPSLKFKVGNIEY